METRTAYLIGLRLSRLADRLRELWQELRRGVEEGRR